MTDSRERPSSDRPTLALTLGDPAGIGPEIVFAATKDERVRAAARLTLVGPRVLRPSPDELAADDLDWHDVEGEGDWDLGRVQEASGRAALAALRSAVELAASGRVDGLVTAPVSKAALHLAGERVEGQTELLARWAGVERYEMIAVAGNLRVMVATRHMPLARAIGTLESGRLADQLELFDEALRSIGISSPHLALAGLNPHAGEGGLLGDEEEHLLQPALESARARGLDVEGPLSPDSVFLRASQGEFDGVLALYHDQAFIPVKLLSQHAGYTWIAGLPYLRFSPVHGTAFDLAGTGRASAENLIQTILAAARACGRRARRKAGPAVGR